MSSLGDCEVRVVIGAVSTRTRRFGCWFRVPGIGLPLVEVEFAQGQAQQGPYRRTPKERPPQARG
jgi:hypothetical protein